MMNFHILQEAASMDLNTDYEDFVNIKGIQVGPLNYAPSDKYSSVNENLVPVSQLKHLPSPSKDDSKCSLHKIQFEQFKFELPYHCSL